MAVSSGTWRRSSRIARELSAPVGSHPACSNLVHTFARRGHTGSSRWLCRVPALSILWLSS